MNNVHPSMFETVYKIVVNRQGSGTCFTLPIDKKKYLITAKHLFGQGINSSTIIEVETDTGLVVIKPVKVITTENPEVDIIALELDLSIVPNFNFSPIKYTSDGITLCHDSLFVGYPLGLQNYNISGAKRGLPLIKKGMISGSTYDSKKAAIGFLLDGHNNKGFSGGPCYTITAENEGVIFGVISSYIPQKDSFYDDQGRERMVILENSGIINTHDIDQIKSLL